MSKHTDLDENFNGYAHASVFLQTEPLTRIIICENSLNEIHLLPSQALALLAWLQQEREQLEHLAKEEA